MKDCNADCIVSIKSRVIRAKRQVTVVLLLASTLGPALGQDSEQAIWRAAADLSDQNSQAVELNRQRAQQLIHEGYALEQQRDLPAAIAKYEAAQQLATDVRVAARIQSLRKDLANQRRVQQLIHEGYALEQQADFAGAIQKYQTAQRMHATDGVEKRIQTLHQTLVDQQRAQRPHRERSAPATGIVASSRETEDAAGRRSDVSGSETFTIKRKGTRYASIEPGGLLEISDHFQKYGSMHADIIGELVNNRPTTGGKAWDLGKSIADDWLKASGAIFEMEGLAYSSQFIGGLSDLMSSVGTALAVAQLAVDYSRGDERAMAVNAFNTAQGLAISKWGTKALAVSMIGVTAIDYSLSKLREQLITGRRDIWRQAHKLYYRENHIRSETDWYNRIKQIHDHARSPDYFTLMLDNELDRFTHLFWNNVLDMAFYQSEAQKSGFTGGGGLNEGLKQDISAAYKSKLLIETLEPVFRKLEAAVIDEKEKEYEQELNRLRAIFNQHIALDIVEQSAGDAFQYAGYIVRFAPLADNVDPTQWTGTLNEKGETRATFTVFGHLSVGAPRTVEFYKDKQSLEDENMEFSMDFTIDVPHTTMTIGRSELKIGDKHEGGVIAYILQPRDPGYERGKVQGLIAAEQDLGPTRWGTHTLDYETATDYGTGKNNTRNLIARCSQQHAARLCHDLVLNGYDDWFMPSKDELHQLFINRAKIGGFKVSAGGKEVWYISSSAAVYAADNAFANAFTDFWKQRFTDQGFRNQGVLRSDAVDYWVRPVRYFVE